jgi:hypothetical protein
MVYPLDCRALAHVLQCWITSQPRDFFHDACKSSVQTRDFITGSFFLSFNNRDSRILTG